MPEPKSKFVERVFESKSADELKSYTGERQPSAQSLALHIDYRDGLSSEGTAWSHFGRYKWRDNGDHETLRIVFGPLCAMEVVGHNLGALIREIREGRLNGIKEMITGQARLALNEGIETPVIASVKAYPDFDALFESIKEEANT